MSCCWIQNDWNLLGQFHFFHRGESAVFAIFQKWVKAWKLPLLCHTIVKIPGHSWSCSFDERIIYLWLLIKCIQNYGDFFNFRERIYLFSLYFTLKSVLLFENACYIYDLHTVFHLFSQNVNIRRHQDATQCVKNMQNCIVNPKFHLFTLQIWCVVNIKCAWSIMHVSCTDVTTIR